MAATVTDDPLRFRPTDRSAPRLLAPGRYPSLSRCHQKVAPTNGCAWS